MRPKTSVFHVALHADVRTLTKAHEAEGKTSTRRETRPSLTEDNSKTSNTTLWCSWYRWTRFFIAQSMSMMSCQADHGARCCCHGKFIRTGMRIFVWKTVEGLRQDPLDLSFWSYLTFLHHGIEKVERHLL